MHGRRHPHLLLLHATDSGGCGLMLGRRDARRGGGAELLLGTCHHRSRRRGARGYHVHPRPHLRRRRGGRRIHPTSADADHVGRHPAAPHRSVIGNPARGTSSTRHHVRRGGHRCRTWSAHGDPAAVRTHHPLLLLHPHHSHALLL